MIKVIRVFTDGHNKGYVNLAWFSLHLLLAVDDIALDVVNCEVEEAVLVVVTDHAAVVDAGLTAVGVAAVLAHAWAVVEADRGGGQQLPLGAGDGDRDVELCLVVMRPVPRQPHTLQLGPGLASLDHQVTRLVSPLLLSLCASSNWKHKHEHWHWSYVFLLKSYSSHHGYDSPSYSCTAHNPEHLLLEEILENLS